MTQARALVVDTEIDLAELLSYHLKKSGYKVSRVTSSKRAIEVAGNRLPKLILLNNLDSTHDHIKLGKQLRDLKREEAIALICLVTDKKVQKKLLAKPKLFDGVLLVPMKPKAMMKEINEIVAKVNTRSTSIPVDLSGPNQTSPSSPIQE